MKITKFLVDGQEAAVSKTALDADVTGSLLPTPAAPVEENPSTDAGKVPTVANNGTYQLTTPSGSADVLNVDVVVDIIEWQTTLERGTATVSVSESDIYDAITAGKKVIVTARMSDDSAVFFYGSVYVLLDTVASMVFPIGTYWDALFTMMEVTYDTNASSWVAKRIPLAPASSAPLLIPVTLDSAPNPGSGITGTTPISERELLAALRSGRPMQIAFKQIDNDGDEIDVVSTALSGRVLLDVADYWIDGHSASLFWADPEVTFTTSGNTTTVTMAPANSG